MSKRLDTKSPDWIAIGFLALLVLALAWFSYDAFRKARMGRELVEAVQHSSLVDVRQQLTDRRFTTDELNEALSTSISLHSTNQTSVAQLEIAKLLLQHGAWRDLAGQYLNTIPIQSHDTAMMNVLFAHNPKLNGNSAIAYLATATQTDNEEAMKWLIAHGVLKFKEINSGNDAAQIAVATNSVKCLKLLLEAGTKTNFSVNNENALCHALSMHYWAIARELVLHGADVNAKGVQGRTPLSIATSAKQNDMVDLLKQHGAK